MKKVSYFFAIICFIILSTVTVQAADNSKKSLEEKVAAMTEEEKQQRVAEIEQRIQEIKEMDKSGLTRIEKKDMKDELRYMNKEAKALGHGGVYISLAGILLIILILIIAL